MDQNSSYADCSTLNKFIKVPKIMYENHKTSLQYYKKGCWMFKSDFTDEYYNLWIYPNIWVFFFFFYGLQTDLKWENDVVTLSDASWA